jgi:ABC-type antimicrobial peptide transport system permease subunit
MNLATAQATKRAREVGIRKIVGARRAALIGQFIGESLLYTALAYVIAIFLAELSLPLFSQIAGHTISISLLSLPMIFLFIGTWVVIGLAAGSYPAFVLASFKPASILKTTLAGTGRGLTLRTIIVIVQFTLAVILLIGTGVIYSQLHYIQTTDRGFDSDNLLSLRMNRDLASKYEQFRTLVASNPAIKTITQTSATPDMVWSVMRGINWEGAPEDANSAFAFIAADHNYLDATGITILQGRNFRSDSPADANAILINEKSMEMLGIADPIGLKLDDGNMEVVGVVQNFNSLPLNYPIEALMIVNMPQYYRMVLLKLDGTNTKEAMQAIEAAWQKVCPDFPFEYRFMDQNFDSTYRSEITAGRLFQVFAMLGIFIACLGLFGLASFLAEQKRLEIGIRKVLGSSSAGIVWHLCRQFVRWIIIANVIAWPLAWYFMRNWLQSFVYRTSINPIIFLLAGVLSVSIAVLTIVARTLHTAQMNPAKALKYE